MHVLSGVTSVLRAGFYAAPFAWLLALGALLGLTIAQVGHFPGYGNPDPKQVEGAWLPYWAVYLLTIPTVVSSLVIGLELLARLLGKVRPLLSPELSFYLVGFALFAAIAFGDAFGLRTWFMD